MKDKTVCIVGLGYVGLPLAKAFSKHLKTIGFDVDNEKIRLLNNDKENIEFTTDSSKIKLADFVIIAVPTPVTKSKEPDLRYVKSAVETVGKNLKKGATVVLESTVYPGVTEEIVAPIKILERESKMKCGIEFYIGYSPERINPGDDAHALTKITKIVAGMDKLFCKQKPLLKIAYAIFCFAKRNISLVKLLKLFKRKVCYDALLSREVIKGFGVNALDNLDVKLKMDGVIVAVAHDEFKKMKLEDVKKFMNAKPVIIDVRGMFDDEEGKGFYYRRL